MKKTREELKFMPKYYLSEIGEFCQVKYIPTYMQKWSKRKIDITCFFLNHLPLKVVTWVENHIL